MPLRSGGGIRMSWGLFLGCWAAAATIALALGRDANHDLLNYHYYIAYALLEGRWGVDHVAAGAHTFLHPGLDLPFFLMTQGPLNGWPRVVAALQSGYAGLLAFVALAVANLACHGEAQRATGASALVAAFGLTGATTVGEVGATQNDIQVGCLILGALLALLLATGADDASEAGRGARLRLLAGALGGAAVGLKLTAIAFPLALALAAALASGPGVARRAQAVALLGLGGALGFALAYGPWGWFLWERFGNPFGPFFNDLFRSPWFPPENPRDTNFLPKGVVQALVYPLLWAHRTEYLAIEPPFADPRFAVGLAALLLAGAAGAWRRLLAGSLATPGEVAGDGAAGRAERAVLAFVAAAYVTWLGLFSILRYAVPIEALLGIPVWAAARALLRAGPVATGRMERASGAAALCLGTALGVCALVTEYPEQSRQPFAPMELPLGPAALAADRIALPEGALVVTVGPNVSFLAPFLDDPGVRFVGATMWTVDSAPYRHAQETRRLIGSHAGPGFALLHGPDIFGEGPRSNLAILRFVGIEFDRATACRPVPNNLGVVVKLCHWR
jgi:hypothetical protein